MSTAPIRLMKDRRREMIPIDKIKVINSRTRDEAQFALEETPVEGFKSHLEYVKERRSSQDAEDVLAGALERLRARRALPD